MVQRGCLCSLPALKPWPRAYAGCRGSGAVGGAALTACVVTEADALSLVVAQRLVAGLDLLEQRVAVDLESDQVRVRALLGAVRSSALVACRCRVGEEVSRMVQRG